MTFSRKELRLSIKHNFQVSMNFTLGKDNQIFYKSQWPLLAKLKCLQSLQPAAQVLLSERKLGHNPMSLGLALTKT